MAQENSLRLMIEDLRARLTAIKKIVMTPTNKTKHKGAADHFAADFDAIRKIIAEAEAKEWIVMHEDGEGFHYVINGERVPVK